MGGLSFLRVLFLCTVTVPATILYRIFQNAGLLHESGFSGFAKYVSAVVWFDIRNTFKKKRLDLYDLFSLNSMREIGAIYPEEEYKLELPQADPYLRENHDEVLFEGVNAAKDVLLVSFSRHSDKLAEVVLVLKTSDGKTFSLPDTLLYDISDSNGFAAGGLRMQPISPTRTWKISYNGLLREKCQGEEERFCHVKLDFLWLTLSECFDHVDDIPPEVIGQLVCKPNVSYETFRSELGRHSQGRNFVEQAGMFKGLIHIEGQEERETFLWGWKLRNLDDRHNNFKREHHYFGFMKDGIIFHVCKNDLPTNDSMLRYDIGIILHSNSFFYPVLKFSEQKTDKDGLKTILHLDAGSRKCIVELNSNEVLIENEGGTFSSMNIHSAVADGQEGKVFELVINRKSPAVPEQIKNILQVTNYSRHGFRETSKFPPKKLVVDFNNPACQDSNLTGGKGSSLAVLTAISKKEDNFLVPGGIVVTTEAYRLFEQNPDLLTEVAHLEAISTGRESGDLREACSRAVAKIRKLKLPYDIKKEIEEGYVQFPGPGTEFAVRSSAVGEDSEEMSAAGQMDTFLCVKGLDNLAEAVVKCWASQFGYIAIQYKRQYGQLLNSPMAVVIQEMVPSEKAGVTFTADPLTGNPAKIIITSNYGLGESVVSATAEPDTVTVHRNRKDFKIDSVAVGSKKLIIRFSGEGSTITEESSEGKRECSISEQEALQLASVASRVETYYGSSRDIEWAFVGNQLFLLQARPITSVHKESEYVIRHMLDTGFKSEDEYFTNANVGEVIPGSISPITTMLTLHIFKASVMEESVKRQGMGEGLIRPRVNIWQACEGHSFFSITEGFIALTRDAPLVQKALTYSILGRTLHDPEAAERAKKRLIRGSFKAKLQQISSSLGDFFLSNYRLKKNAEKFWNCRPDLENCTDSLSMMTVVGDSSLPAYKETGACHIGCTYASSIFNMGVLMTLASAQGDVTPEVFSDFSKAVTVASNVESADVAQSVKEVARAILSSSRATEFSSMSVKDATKWLETTNELAGQKYKEFLNKHGHRCIKEFDYISLPWSLNQEGLMDSLKTLVSVGCDQTTSVDTSSLGLDTFQVPLNFKQRLLLRIFIPLARKGVAWRERAKSIMIRSVHNTRLGLLRLGEKLYEEGRIPDKHLMHFFTWDELYRVINTRSPQLVARALHRQRLYPVQDKLKFQTVIKGLLRPVERKLNGFIADADVRLTGTPVSQGSVKGRARVVTELKDATSIQRGEILITIGTDTGWTPYFPLLSGIVTELGGLLSHGAVVAREYGMPCVVGIENATEILKTGDNVLVDGTKGIVQRLTKEDEE